MHHVKGEWIKIVDAGISQRDCSHFYPYMLKEKEDIVRDISSFFREQIKDKFPLDSYVLDVVRRWKDKVTLIDVLLHYI